MAEDKRIIKEKVVVTPESTPHFTLSDYHPSGSALPYTDETWNSEMYINFLRDKRTQEETKLSIKKEEIDKIAELETKEDCHRYRLKLNAPISWTDTFLVVFDNILKILPVVLVSSLPILFLTNINSQDFDMNLLYYVYGLMIIVLFVSMICRSFIKKKSMTLDQYLVAVNKKEESLS